MKDETFAEAMERKQREGDALLDGIATARREYAAQCAAYTMLAPYWSRFPGATVAGILEMMTPADRAKVCAYMVTAGTASLVAAGTAGREEAPVSAESTGAFQGGVTDKNASAPAALHGGGAYGEAHSDGGPEVLT